MSQAINSPWAAALETAFVLGRRDGVLRRRFLELIDEALRLDAPEGLLARAIISARLSWLRLVAPDWFAEREPLIFGDGAPGDLGEATFAMYLEYGAPTEALVLEQRPRLLDALGGPAAEFARRHLLHGLLWGVEGFSPSEVCDALAAVGPDSLKEAAHWLGWALAESAEDIEPALALWREVLSRDLSTAAYSGWGWFVVNEQLADDVWLDLTLQTAARAGGNLEEADRVAERAGGQSADPRALQLLAHLLDSEVNIWELDRIGQVGLQLLRDGAGDASQRQELRERLLERGFHDAADIS